MNKLTQTLLTGSALCALGAAPAMAQPTHPAMHVMALHAGHAVNKTKLHHSPHCDFSCTLTYTLGVYTSKPASARKSDIYGTFYRLYDTNSVYSLIPCTNPKQHLEAPKRSVYARIDKGTETISFGCPSGPTEFYGDVWTNKTGVPGNVDTFRSSLIGHFRGNRSGGNGKYKATLNFDVSVNITQ